MNKAEKRQRLERYIVNRMLDILELYGWTASWLNDGGDQWESCPTERKELMASIFAVNECCIRFTKQDLTRGVQLVFGNDGYDCIADHSLSNLLKSYDDFELAMYVVQGFVEEKQKGCVIQN